MRLQVKNHSIHSVYVHRYTRKSGRLMAFPSPFIASVPHCPLRRLVCPRYICTPEALRSPMLPTFPLLLRSLAVFFSISYGCSSRLAPGLRLLASPRANTCVCWLTSHFECRGFLLYVLPNAIGLFVLPTWFLLLLQLSVLLQASKKADGAKTGCEHDITSFKVLLFSIAYKTDRTKVLNSCRYWFNRARIIGKQ